MEFWYNEATLEQTNSSSSVSLSENGFTEWESTSICPMFSPCTKIGITISDFTFHPQDM